MIKESTKLPSFVITSPGWRKAVFVLIPTRTRKITAGISALLQSHRSDLKLTLANRWTWWQYECELLREKSLSLIASEPEAVLCKGCNGSGRSPIFEDHDHQTCLGTGRLPKWPARWKAWIGNALPVGQMPKDIIPHVLVCPDGRWYDHSEYGSPHDFQHEILGLYGRFSDCFAIALVLCVSKPCQKLYQKGVTIGLVAEDQTCNTENAGEPSLPSSTCPIFLSDKMRAVRFPKGDHGK